MKIYPLSENQENALVNSDYRINLFEGAKRSGKTFVALLRWIRFIATEVKDDELLIFCGLTAKRIDNNITLIKDIVGSDNVQYGRYPSELIIYGKKHILLSVEDPNSVMKICGTITKGVFCDEIDFYPKSLVDMLMSRASVEGVRTFWTCNPTEDPKHFIKKDFIDLKDRINEHDKDFQHWHFTMDDNPFLSESYKTHLKNIECTDDQYNRLVLGKWPDENIPTK